MSSSRESPIFDRSAIPKDQEAYNINPIHLGHFRLMRRVMYVYMLKMHCFPIS